MDLKSLDIASLAGALFTSNEAEKKSTADLNISIENRNGFNLTGSGLYAELKYQGVIVAKSADTEANSAKFTIPAYETATFVHTLDLFVNQQFLDAAKGLITGSKMEFEYYVRLRIFGFIPFWWTSTFEYGG